MLTMSSTSSGCSSTRLMPDVRILSAIAVSVACFCKMDKCTVMNVMNEVRQLKAMIGRQRRMLLQDEDKHTVSDGVLSHEMIDDQSTGPERSQPGFIMEGGHRGRHKR
jgi:hypothetical protein